MNREEFADLLRRGEGQSLEWKADFPGELRADSGSAAWEKGKAIFLKDLVSLANGLEEGTGYLVYGVKDHGSRREVVGKSRAWDDADLQTWAQNAFVPPPDFAYFELSWDEDLEVGIFSVQVSPAYPHVVDESTGGILSEGQVWTRRGSQNALAKGDELRQMFKGPEPLMSGGTNGIVVTKTTEYWRNRGYELAFPRFLNRDNKMHEGWTPACYPGTRREVHVFRAVGQPDLILMKKPIGAADSNGR